MLDAFYPISSWQKRTVFNEQVWWTGIAKSPAPVDIAFISETWQPDQVSDDYIAIDGFNLFTKKRTAMKGSVAVYIKDAVHARKLTDVDVPEDLECLWLWICPNRLPRSVAGIAICAVYILQILHTKKLLLIIDFLHWTG